MTLIKFLIFLCSSTFIFGSATDIISSSQPLKDPASIVSSNGTFKLGFFTPTNSTKRYVGIWFNKPVMNVIWVANCNNPLNDSYSGVIRISKDGNLQILSGRNEIVWSSNTSNSAFNVSTARLLDSGNLVLLGFNPINSGENGTVIWQSFDHITDSLLPNMKITGTKNSKTRNVLTSWKSPSDPSEGRFTAAFDSIILPQLVVWDGDRPHWRAGPWNGNIFIGVQYDIPDFINAQTVIDDDRKGTISLTYFYPNKSLLSNYAVQYDGTSHQIYWDEGKRNWEVEYWAPETVCDVYGTCGLFGVCNSKKTPICRCLDGFEPKNREEWSKGKWTSGCVRRTNLQCGKDGFLKLKRMKVPDHAEWLMGSDEDSCRMQCLKNCSCLAYAYDTGAGCMTWSRAFIDIAEFHIGGVDLYVRLARSELGKSKVRTISAVVGTLGALALAAFIYFLWRLLARSREEKNERKKRASDMFRDETTQAAKVEELPLFDFKQLATATNYFDRSNKLGQGGFGPVYWGKLENGQEIAVKRLSRASTQGVEEFMNETMVISKLQHRNLVRLLGCCITAEDKMLVYEYMPNKSLDAFLSDPMRKGLLDWKKRFNIMEGVCRGLIYLHRDSRLKITHRDLKASNILLDEHLTPKISDFGMARMFWDSQDHADTRTVVGTYGYMSPEYAMEGRFSEKSDVFSLGVLILEIISGKKTSSFWHEEQSLSLTGYAWKLLKEGNIVTLIDPTISEPNFHAEIIRCIKVGLLCVQEFAKDRPSISTVMSMLTGEISLLPHPNKPGFALRHFASETDSADQHFSSVNMVSVTSISGR